MEKKFKMLPPIMPNFLPYATERSGLQDPQSDLSGQSKRNHISVADLNESEAIEYGELMKQAFIDHWKNKTKKY